MSKVVRSLVSVSTHACADDVDSLLLNESFFLSQRPYRVSLRVAEPSSRKSGPPV